MLHCEYFLFLLSFSLLFFFQNEKRMWERGWHPLRASLLIHRAERHTNHKDEMEEKKSNVGFRSHYFMVVCNWCSRDYDTLQGFLCPSCLTDGSLCSLFAILWPSINTVRTVCCRNGQKSKTIHRQKRWRKGSIVGERKLKYFLSDSYVIFWYSLFCFQSICVDTKVEADWQPGAAVPHLCSPPLTLCVFIRSPLCSVIKNVREHSVPFGQQGWWHILQAD